MNSKQNHRRLRRFFVSDLPQELDQEVWLDEKETKHLQHTLRLQKGDSCLIFNGKGIEALAEVLDFQETKTCLKLKSWSIPDAAQEQTLWLRVIQGLPQKGKMDFLVEKAQEIGINELYPVLTERAQIKLTNENRLKVHDRWVKKAIQASKQCGASQLLNIKAVESLQKAIQEIPETDAFVLFHPSPETRFFADWLLETREKEKDIHLTLCIGPEGGFSSKEVELIKKIRTDKRAPFIMVNLGQSTLRLETAFIGASTAVKLMLS